MGTGGGDLMTQGRWGRGWGGEVGGEPTEVYFANVAAALGLMACIDDSLRLDC